VTAAAKIAAMATGIVRTAALGVVARHRIPDVLMEGPLTADELAVKTGLHARSLHRMLRALVAFGVFAIEPDGRFANNDVSRALREPWLTSFAAFFGSPAMMQAYSDFEGMLQTGQNAFERVHKQNKWDWFSAHEEDGRAFARHMRDLTALVSPYVAASFAFSQLGMLCDVGGGDGMLLATILAKHPKLRGVVFDEAYVLSEADQVFAKAGVSERASKIAGTFFESVPEGADGYLLKDVLHDWDDARCHQILANVRRAARAGTSLLIVESLFETTEVHEEKAVFDMQMMTLNSGGQQRTVEQFRGLLAASGFRLDRTRPITTLFSLLVATGV
jgi:hypothetical protein